MISFQLVFETIRSQSNPFFAILMKTENLFSHDIKVLNLQTQGRGITVEVLQQNLQRTTRARAKKKSAAKVYQIFHTLPEKVLKNITRLLWHQQYLDINTNLTTFASTSIHSSLSANSARLGSFTRRGKLMEIFAEELCSILAYRNSCCTTALSEVSQSGQLPAK